MIEILDKTFHLQTDDTSYLFLINEHGHPEQVHYGRRVQLSDWKSLRYRHDIVYGSEVLYTPDDDTYCLDNVPLEWSGVGKGDFRVSPIEPELPDSTYVTDFVYQSHRVVEGVCPPQTLADAYDESGKAQTLILTLRDTLLPIELELYYTVFPAENVITRRAVMHNTMQASLMLHKLMSCLIDLPQEACRLLTLSGDWIREANARTQPLVSGLYINESTTGASSNRHNPGVALAAKQTSEDFGAVWGFNLIYSGNHQTAVELSPRGFVRVLTGINPQCFHWQLAAGTQFETPTAVLTYSERGWNGMSRNFHAFVQAHLVRGAWRDRERPVLVNNWEACFFEFTRRRLLRLARRAKQAGAELFVLDDGWFGARNNDRAGLGDYNVNYKKLPGGLARLGRDLNRQGLQFGLWFEPESVNTDSDLYRAHPEYAVQIPNRAPSFGRNQLLLDLTRQDVRDYIVKSVSQVLDSAPISYVKWDMNRHMSDVYSAGCSAGEFAHRYILGLYEILRRIFYPRPEILLESCSSGGNRFDLGMLCFSPQIWASDDTDPVERLRIQTGLSYFYPPSCMGAHVSQAPHQQTLRTTPLSTRFHVAAFGALGYELDFAELTAVERAQIREQIAFYRKWRRVFQFGNFSRTDTGNNNQYQFNCVLLDKRRAVVLRAQTLSEAAQNGDTLKIEGLDETASYQICAVAQRVAVSRFGGLVKHILPVKCKADGFVLRLANRHYALPDGSFSAQATGSALAGGIALNTQYIGTGYSKDLRLWGDFGSQLYTVEMKEEESANDTL